MKMDLEMELHNAKSSSSAGMRKRKKRKRKSDAVCNYNDSGLDCPEGASSMQDTPLQEYSCAQSTVDISSNSGLIAESTVDINSGLIEAQSNSDLVCSENKIKRKRKQKQKRHNAPTTDNTESTVDISSNSGLIAESTVDINSGLMEAQYNSDLVCSENKKKKKRRQKQKRHNAPTDNTESADDIRYNSGLIEAHNNSSLLCSENKKKRKRQQLEKKLNTDADIQEVASKTTSAPFKTVALVDMITKAVSETAPLEVEALGDTSTKMDLAAEMNASVDTSMMIHSAKNLNRSERKNLRKKLHEQGVHVLEHDSKNRVLPGDKSLNKNVLRDKDSSVQQSVDISKNELVVKQPNGNLCSFNGHNTSENGRDVNLQMENDKNFQKEDTRKMDFAATDIDMNVSVDTSAVIHSTQNLGRSERKKLRKKLHKQGALVLEHDAALDHVLPGDNSLSTNMFPEKHSSLQSAVDMFSKNELVVKMENGKNLEKQNTKKMDLAATPIKMNTSVDTSTMIHSSQNLSLSERKKLRKKSSKQGVHVLEHDASKDSVLPADNSPSKSMFPEKHLSVQLSVGICSKNELVGKRSNGDVCSYDGQSTSENDRDVNLQMENDKNFEKEDTRKMDFAAADIDMNVSVDTSTAIHSAQDLSRSERKKLRKKLHKQGALVLEHDAALDRVLLGDNSLNKNMFPEKHSYLQSAVDMFSKNELVVKMENGKNLEKENTKKMDLAATPIEMNASVDTSTMIHSAQNLSQSERKKLRKKLSKQGVHVLEHDASKDRVLPADDSPSKSMFPEKHLSVQPSVDICSKNELVGKQSNGDVCLYNGQSTSENDSVYSLQMEHDKNLEKVDLRKMDLAASPIEMNASVDTSTMIHSAQNLGRSERKKLGKKLCKQGVHVLEHDASKDHVPPGDNSLRKNVFPEKHSSVQPSVDICSKNELVVKRSNGDASLFNGHSTSENDSAIILQIEHGKNLEKVDATKMDLAATPIEMNASVETSTMIHSTQNLSRSERKKLRKKLRKQGVHVLEHDASKDHVPPGDNPLSKNVFPEKHSSMQPSVDICSKNELVVKRSNGDDGHGTSENDSAIILQMEHGKNLEKVDATKMDFAATPIEMDTSVDTSTMIHSAQNLSRSERKKLRKKLRKQGVRVLEYDASKDHVPSGDNSLSKNVFPEKHSSLQPSVDICPKNELVVKRSNGVASLFDGNSMSENDSVISLQMEHGKNLEKVDATKMDLAATPIEMNASVDTSTMIHSSQNLSGFERKKSRKKLCKQGVHVLEHDASKDHVLPGVNSLSRNVFPEKHSSLQLSIDICSMNELAVNQSNGDVCFFNGHNASENNRVIDLQMPDGKHLENKEAKPVPKAAELDLTSVREDFPLSVKQSSCSNSANRSLLEKDDVRAESHSTSSMMSNIITYKRRKIFKTYIRTKRKKVSDSLINSLDCIKEDEDSLMKNVSVLSEGQLEQKERDKLDGIQISVRDASHGDGVSDEIPAHPMEDNLSGLDRSCKLPREQHVEVETKTTETFPPSHLGVMKSDVLHAACKEENHPQILLSPPERVCVGHSKKKLLVLDVNGLLADVVQSPCRRYKPDKMVSKKAVFKRPYCDEFLRFCFERFNVGVWSSRVKKNLDIVIEFLMGDSRKNLLFCWHQSQCSKTGLNTIENKKKPLVLKELKKLWEKLEPNLPWEKGEYNETNTLLLDDSPYKALCNPAHTAIFPYPYDYRNAKDASLGSGGDLRVYLEGLADTENVQEYVRQNPFGQRAITEKNPSWGFYSKVFRTKPRPPPYDDGDGKVTNAKSCEPCDNGNTSFTCQQP